MHTHIYKSFLYKSFAALKSLMASKYEVVLIFTDQRIIS